MSGYIKLSQIVLIFFLFLCHSNVFGETEMKIQFLYDNADFKNNMSILPVTFNIHSRNISLFAVPHNNSVGTNDTANGITVISFPNGRMTYDTYFRHFTDDIGGGGIFMPVISPESIGFGQVRRFLLCNFSRGYCRKFRIAMSINDTIEKIATSDGRRDRFIFEIESQNINSNDPWDTSSVLQLIDLSGDQPKTISEIHIGSVSVWSVVSDKNLLYNLTKNEVQVFDMALKSSQHPLATEINRNRNDLSFTWIHPHPHLPFAILSGGENGSTLITWGEAKKKHSLIGIATKFSFSPDGKWVSFINQSNSQTIKTYVMPVSHRFPYYLGFPILLSEHDVIGEHNASWTTNPVSFVGSYDDKIYRWDLTNETHHESDKATFHDYIVERDLKRMATEKRQGLGEKQK